MNSLTRVSRFIKVIEIFYNMSTVAVWFEDGKGNQKFNSVKIGNKCSREYSMLCLVSKVLIGGNPI